MLPEGCKSCLFYVIFNLRNFASLIAVNLSIVDMNKSWCLDTGSTPVIYYLIDVSLPGRIVRFVSV